MTEVSKELIQKREEQRQGLKNLFTKVFTEYYGKHKEFPPLLSPEHVKIFIGERTDIHRSVEKLNLVQDLVEEVALRVLKELSEKKKKELEGKE